ncbi:type IV pilus twitching motility protein PilT [Sporolactobacillus pectinivorans]|uniref:type IV pilus twitching motility protein PilT n=1 Tax=Sporolactobacillus pectinivorans TaxID=1591408 RepID=UPI000C257964|nr:type IV pilus twitching motility protein PilT [Sporolactobacillus pectinivorans]
MINSLREYLETACERKASDLHISVGIPPTIRTNGELVALERPDITPEDTETMIRSILSDEQLAKLNSQGELDFSFSIPKLSRFRVNAFRQRSCLSLAFRVIPQNIPDLASLHLPDELRALSHRSHGLLLVTGPAGSGKSTTLAALVDDMNKNARKHVITLEDPIEYLHKHNQCIIQQREVGSDTQSFAVGLRAALREDPDVILVGELHDMDTIRTALTAAETGHLVLAAMHTSDAVSTVNRLIDIFPAEQQGQIRVQLAAELAAVISQRLFPTSDFSGRRVATEVMINNKNIGHLIREGKIYQIPSVIQVDHASGMQTMASCIQGLLARKAIATDAVVPLLKR